MCGIAGVLDPSASTPPDELCRTAARMAGPLAHRGPDGVGEWADPAAGVAFGFRRLAIVDLTETGAQPMVSSSGRHILVFNGEIYNAGALRLELESLGVSFRGTSDTEVLVEAFQRWGVRPALERTNGMFALAMWDRERRRLTLARDRLGEKPLYYGWSGGRFAFGSELRALRAVPGFALSVDRGATALLLRHGYVPAPRSIYQEVEKLEPGCLVEVDPGRPEVQPAPERWWSVRDVAEAGLRSPLRLDIEEAADQVEALLSDSVRLRMVADVPVGAFLSGGIDSSLVVALMGVSSPTPVRTFTIGFGALGCDEAASAAAVARHLGTDHTSVDVTDADSLELVPALATAYDEPFADPSAIPTMLLARLARRSVTVCLSGDGGDELFAGYSRYASLSGALRRAQRLPLPLRRGMAAAVAGVSPATWDALGAHLGGVVPALRQHRLGSKADKLAGALRAGDAEAYRRIMSRWDPASILPGVAEPATAFDRPPPNPGDEVDRAMLIDLESYLPDGILVKVDRATMAASLEARVPLLDHRLVELAWRLPRRTKLVGTSGKLVMRAVLDRHVPRELVDRPKQGFGVPLSDWLRGPLRPWAEDLLAPARLAASEGIDVAVARAAWADHRRGTRDRSDELWPLLVLESWREAEKSAVTA